MVNLTGGASGVLCLRLRNPALKQGQTTVLFCSMTEPPCHLPLMREGDDFLVSVPSLDAWSIGTVFIAE